jgi:hypothetical protein
MCRTVYLSCYGAWSKPEEGKRMAKNDQEEMFEKLMAANLARAVDYIKFAETKNAALLTFCSAWLLGIASLLSSGKTIPRFVDSGFRLGFIFFALGAVVAISSFLPRLVIRPKNNSAAMNLLYFGDIASMLSDEFSVEIRRRYFPEKEHAITEGYVSDLAEQIYVNSQIATRKMRLFKWGARSVMLALFMLVSPAIGQIL